MKSLIEEFFLRFELILIVVSIYFWLDLASLASFLVFVLFYNQKLASL